MVDEKRQVINNEAPKLTLAGQGGETVAAKIVGSWVVLGANVGFVLAEDTQYATSGAVLVKFISTPRHDGKKYVYDAPFAEQQAVLVSANALTGIEEPQLDRGQAAAYLGVTPSRLYQLRQDGWFGGIERTPFYATPTELNAYAAAPKPTHRWNSDEIHKQQKPFKRVGNKKKK